MKRLLMFACAGLVCSWSSPGRPEPPPESPPDEAYPPPVVVQQHDPVVVAQPVQRGPVRDRPVPSARKPREHHIEPLWIDGGGGVEHVDLRTFRADRDTLSAGIFPTVATGPAAHLGIGARIYMLSLGARASMADVAADSSQGGLGHIQLWSIDAEAGFHVLDAPISPYLLLGGGYTTIGGLGDAVQGLGQGLDVNGANARLGIGIDVRATEAVHIDGRLVGEIVALSRRGVPLRDLAQPQKVGTLNEAEARVLQGNGSSLGTTIGITVGPSVEF